MIEPDPDIIRMISDGMRFQNPEIPAPDVPRGREESYPWTSPINSEPMGYPGHRISSDLDMDELAPFVTEPFSTPAMEPEWPV